MTIDDAVPVVMPGQPIPYKTPWTANSGTSSVTLATTAKGMVTMEVTVYDLDPNAAADKAAAILDRLREKYKAANENEFYRG